MQHRFVDFLPDKMEEGILYVSIKYATAAHKCCSGCGLDVVTPITPTDWSLSFDGDSVSLNPSIGNWSFPCRSHYFIRNNKVLWAGDMSQQKIDAGRSRDRLNKEMYFGDQPMKGNAPAELPVPSSEQPGKSIWGSLANWLRPKK